MKLYKIVIAYTDTLLIIGSVRRRITAEKLTFKLQEDPCYASPDAKWRIETRDVTFWEWLFK